MNIVYGNNRVRKQCDNARGKLKRRLDDIRAADNFQDLLSLPGNCHRLKGDRETQWAMDADHPRRLIFKPLADPLPVSDDGWLDLKRIMAVLIIEVGDYHG
jgi:proteic killer suppression protein